MPWRRAGLCGGCLGSDGDGRGKAEASGDGVGVGGVHGVERGVEKVKVHGGVQHA